MPVTVSAGDAPAELRAAVLAMKQVPNEVKRIVSSDMRETLNPAWRSETTQRLTGAGVMEGRLLLAGARIAPGNPPALVAANSRKKLGHGGGLIPSEDWQMYEFGSHGTKLAQLVSRKGKKYTRHASRGLPRFAKKGRVLYPAAAAILPRVAAYWVQSIVRAVMEAAEGKSS